MKKTLPAKRINVVNEPTSPIGIALRSARLEKQIPQRVIAEALAERCGGRPDNVRVSNFELSRKLPTDAELTVLAQVLGLSVVSLREKREASRAHQKIANKVRYAEQVASGVRRPLTTRVQLPAPSPPPKLKQLKAAKPAQVPALAELVEQIDEIAPMPADKDARRRWFTCVSELSRMAAS